MFHSFEGYHLSAHTELKLHGIFYYNISHQLVETSKILKYGSLLHMLRRILYQVKMRITLFHCN